LDTHYGTGLSLPKSSRTSPENSKLRSYAFFVRSSDIVFAVEDPRDQNVRVILDGHLAYSKEVTPPGHVHALAVESLLDPAITLFGARRAGALVGIRAVRRLDVAHAELKSMHTVESARRQGVGRAMVDHLLGVAVARNYAQVSLETGTMEAFASARALYRQVGFRPCQPFGEYTDNPNSVCMTLYLSRGTTPTNNELSSTGEDASQASCE